MLPEVIELEKLRQEIDEVEYATGDLSDYLDLGRPNEQQTQQTLKQMEQNKKRSTELRTQLHELLASLRTDKPEMIQEWVQWHRDICQRILTEPRKSVAPGERQILVKEILQNWEKVVKGEQDHVRINPAYLKDYIEEVQGLGEKKAEKKVEKKAGKWWKFWER